MENFNKVDKNELFCRECLTHETFFSGRHASSKCPECDGAACILYGNLSPLKRAKAREKFALMWKEKNPE